MKIQNIKAYRETYEKWMEKQTQISIMETQLSKLEKEATKLKNQLNEYRQQKK